MTWSRHAAKTVTHKSLPLSVSASRPQCQVQSKPHLSILTLNPTQDEVNTDRRNGCRFVSRSLIYMATYQRQPPVGLQVLRLAIADSTIDSITILSRRPMPDYVPTSPKANVIVLEDFLKYPLDILPTLASHDACIWALGGSSKGHTEESYAVFTVDYVKAAISALKDGGVAKGREHGNNPFRFIFISGEYANPEEKSMFLYARVKVCFLTLAP
jgi:hypothetical protein